MPLADRVNLEHCPPLLESWQELVGANINPRRRGPNGVRAMVAQDNGLKTNGMKASLASGGFAIGAYIGFVRNPAMMRILAGTGYDFAFIDTTHSGYSWETLSDFCDMARACGLDPILRPYEQSHGVAQRMLDIGAAGLLYPDVRSGEDASRLAHNLKYPPLGGRGAFGLNGPLSDYALPASLKAVEVREHLDANTLLAIQVESAEAIDMLDDILSVGGIDVVEVGRSDLSTSYGAPLEIRHPKVLAAVDKVASTCAKYGVAPGAGCYSQEDASDMVARGMRWLTYSSDTKVIVSGYAQGSDMLRSIIARHQGG
ncbi:MULTISPECIES: aldolase/citrate lyase family protein [unclassified Chelatococcus]|uniref:HpcH/HpaI aldolase family protein n=1 Tax=unclassified Chelatococcus TaxID=2638111 RepID=UPI001BCF390F|nr:MULTISPECIES: aldolase/citrate lyase family protein [unclassified Chelatococcus]MBS7701538.1 hypothetical protein [Chelatococcus sp. YT9]MBX3557373.1 hypothetical protein [Chelatococcus sp.]